MFGKLFNSLSNTINMTGENGGPGVSGFGAPANTGAGPSIPSLSSLGFGLGSSPAPPPQAQQLRPRQPGPMRAPRPPPPSSSGPMDVDLTGLSEEEKAMIQSVMMRAQADTQPAPAPTPPTQPTQLAPQSQPQASQFHQQPQPHTQPTHQPPPQPSSQLVNSAPQLQSHEMQPPTSQYQAVQQTQQQLQTQNNYGQEARLSNDVHQQPLAYSQDNTYGQSQVPPVQSSAPPSSTITSVSQQYSTSQSQFSQHNPTTDSSQQIHFQNIPSSAPQQQQQFEQQSVYSSNVSQYSGQQPVATSVSESNGSEYSNPSTNPPTSQYQQPDQMLYQQKNQFAGQLTSETITSNGSNQFTGQAATNLNSNINSQPYQSIYANESTSNTTLYSTLDGNVQSNGEPLQQRRASGTALTSTEHGINLHSEQPNVESATLEFSSGLKENSSSFSTVTNALNCPFVPTSSMNMPESCTSLPPSTQISGPASSSSGMGTSFAPLGTSGGDAFTPPYPYPSRRPSVELSRLPVSSSSGSGRSLPQPGVPRTETLPSSSASTDIIQLPSHRNHGEQAHTILQQQLIQELEQTMASKPAAQFEMSSALGLTSIGNVLTQQPPPTDSYKVNMAVDPFSGGNQISQLSLLPQGTKSTAHSSSVQSTFSNSPRMASNQQPQTITSYTTSLSSISSTGQPSSLGPQMTPMATSGSSFTSQSNAPSFVGTLNSSHNASFQPGGTYSNEKQLSSGEPMRAQANSSAPRATFSLPSSTVASSNLHGPQVNNVANVGSVSQIPRTVPLQVAREMPTSGHGSNLNYSSALGPNTSSASGQVQRGHNAPVTGLGGYQQPQASSFSSSLSSSSSSQLSTSLQSQALAKKCPTAPLECWSESELSPIQDVSPSLEAAEQRSMEQMKRNPIHEAEYANGQPVGGGMTRATSGTISHMIADFNKQMEALNTSSPTDEQLYSRRGSNQRRSSQSKATTNSSSNCSNGSEAFERRGSLTKSMPVSSFAHTTTSYTVSKKVSLPVSSSSSSTYGQQGPHQGQQLSKTEATYMAARSQHSEPNSALNTRSSKSLSHQEPSYPSTSLASSTQLRTQTVQRAPDQLHLSAESQAKQVAQIVSPVIEQSLQQQHLLLNQQQQLLQLQKEQQVIQRQLQQQLSMQHEQHMEALASAKKDRDQPKQPQIVVKEVHSTGTSTTPARERAPPMRNNHRDQSLHHGQGKKERRRLPQPTVEEFQGAVQAIAGHSFSATGGATSILGNIMPRPVSPILSRSRTHNTGQHSVISLTNALRSRPSSGGTVLGPSGPTVMASTVNVAPAITMDQASASNLLISGFQPGMVISPLAFSPACDVTSLSDSASDSGWKNKRRLPVVPQDEEPVTAALARRQLVRDRCRSTRSTNSSPNHRHALRPSSSLDSATTGAPYRSSPPAHRPSSGGPLSPYSSLSDIANLINSSAVALGQLTPFLTSHHQQHHHRQHHEPGKTSTGHLIDQLSRSPSRGINSEHRDSSMAYSPSSPILPGYMKTLKQQLRDELKTAVHERSRLLGVRERDKDLYRKSESDLDALFDLYSNVPDVVLPTRSDRTSTTSRPHSRYGSDSKLGHSYSPMDDIPPGYYKSYEENASRNSSAILNDSRRSASSMAKIRQLAAMSGMSGLLRDLNDLDADGHRYRRRSEGSVDLNAMDYAMDPYGRNVPMGTPLRGRLLKAHTQETEGRGWNSSSLLDENINDNLTREEKAAKIRAEIARRRQKLVEGHLREMVRGGQSRTSGYPAGYYGDQEGSMDNQQMADDYLDLAYMDEDRTRAVLSRQLDPDYLDDYYDPAYGSYADQSMNAEPFYGYARDTPDYGDNLHMPASMPLLDIPSSRTRKVPSDAELTGYGASGRGSPRRVHKNHRYPFPVKRILLTRDPKERNGNGFGMRVIGGKTIPNSNGMIGAYVSKIIPGGVVDTLGEVCEGNQVMEWNSIALTGKTHEEVQEIIQQSVNSDEVEVIVRADVNLMDSVHG
ncbi:Uncharacterized protein HDE_10739 [Halotydeus destructor]|nr:Uncharacterized protein HDE_10739 [Halotydeus destructor]